ncbi:hypothetical protein [Mumia quercus]|uniref:hypothetical protein n=1 Tax=Mumia quercus TaxID=2976125 RepID=UPI0021D354E8|nr:hypothetical protein [Mumia quercus]
MTRTLTALTVAALFVVSGCGDDDDDGGDKSPAATETTEWTTATTPTTPPTPEEPDLAQQVQKAFSDSYGWPKDPTWEHITKFTNDNGSRVTVVTDLADKAENQAEAQGYCNAVVSVSSSVSARMIGAVVTAGEGGPFLAECDVSAY